MLVDVPLEKKAILNLRLDTETRQQFGIAAKLKGASMSGLLHQYIIRTIREEKQACPEAFGERTLAPVVAHISGAIDPEAERQRIEDDLHGRTLAAKGKQLPMDKAAPRRKKKVG